MELEYVERGMLNMWSLTLILFAYSIGWVIFTPLVEIILIHVEQILGYIAKWSYFNANSTVDLTPFCSP